MVLTYQTVFEVTDKSIVDIMMFIPTILLAFFIVIYVVNRNRPEAQKGMVLWFSLIVVTSIVSIITIFATLKSRLKTRNDFYNKSYSIVEGKVENFDPMPAEGHKSESFDLQGIHFEYSDYNPSYSFNNSASHGGPIWGDGQELRIGYVQENRKNYILKIEVKLD